MTRRKKDPLRPLREDEREYLEKISRGRTAPLAQVVRATEILAVADGKSYTAAAQAAQRKSGDAVAELVARFNREGVAAIAPGHGGGPQVQYGLQERERILAEVRRTPDREQDGTATWSLSTLQRALRTATDGLPDISTYTIWTTLHAAGLSWQESRTWCETGKVQRKRKAGVVEVTDPETEAKKT